MNSTANKQSGFSIVEALIAVVIVGAIAATGFFVYQHNQVKVTDAAPNTSQPTAPTTTTVGYLQIKEWGVRLSLDNTTASLYYYINPQLPNVAYLSLKSISDVAPACGANNGPLGAISRLTSTEHQDALSGKTHSIPGTIQIGSYWYGYEASHADCTDGTAAAQAAISKAAPNFNASTLINTFTTLAADPSTN
jgi:pilin/secretion family protein with methylation motif